MSQQLLLAFILFAVVMFITPGPNNIMVLSSGITYGFRRTVPHIAGITIGVAFMVATVGLGFGTVFLAYPVLQTVLKYAGAAYLVYLAVMIALSGPPKPGARDGRGPMTFWGAALFQWVNVKGWVMVIGTITAYAAIARFPLNVAIQTMLCLPLGVVSTALWTLFGSALRPVMTSERAVRAFNIVMALLLLASLYPVFADA
jgi:threonine/homoserine/homoserine lactone efflux protein